MKTKFFYLMVLLFLSYSGFGQMLQEIYPAPKNENGNSSLIVSYNYLPGCKANLMTTQNVSSDSIIVTSFYDSTIKCTEFYVNDTVDLGKLSPGFYVIIYRIMDMIDSSGAEYMGTSMYVSDDMDSTGMCKADFTYSFDNQNYSIYSYNFYDQSEGGPVAWNWHFSNGLTSTMQNPPMYFDSVKIGDTLSATLFIVTNSGCVDSTTKYFTVQGDTDVCKANFMFEKDTTDYGYIFYDQSSENTISWLWDFGDGYTSTSKNEFHYFDSLRYQPFVNVSLSITTSDGCTDTQKQTIYNLSDTDKICSADFSYIWLYDSTNTVYGVQFYDNSMGNPISWEWDLGKGMNSSAQNPYIYFYPPTDYDSAWVSLTTANAYGCVSEITKLVINPFIIQPVCNISFSYFKDTTSNNPNTYGFYAYPENQVIEWGWDFGDGGSSTLQYPVHTFTSPADSVTVCLTVFTADSCIANYCQTIILENEKAFTIEGVVFAGNKVSKGSIVIVYQLNSGSYDPTGVAITNSLGTYSISNQQAGDYILYVLPNPSITNKYLPTYYVDQLSWEKADNINLKSNIYDLDISLLKANKKFNGNGKIKGKIRNYSSFSYLQELGNMPIILSTDNDVDLFYTHTDNNGEFEFDSLYYGEYKVRPEIPNVKGKVYTLSLTPEQSEILDVEFVFEQHTYTQVINNDKSVKFNYNSKTKELVMTANYLDEPVEIQIINSLGQIKKIYKIKMSGSNETKISMQDLYHDLYFVRASVLGNQAGTYKFIK